MATRLRFLSLPGGLLIKIGGELGDLRLRGYRPVEARVGSKITHGRLVKPSEALAARRFETIYELVAGLQPELSK